MIPENFNFEGGCSATTLRKFGASDKRFPCAAMDFGSGCAASETLIMSAWNFVITATGGYVKATGFSGARVRIARARINRGVYQDVEPPYREPQAEHQQAKDRRKEHHGFSESQNGIHLSQEIHASSVY